MTPEEMMALAQQIGIDTPAGIQLMTMAKQNSQPELSIDTIGASMDNIFSTSNPQGNALTSLNTEPKPYVEKKKGLSLGPLGGTPVDVDPATLARAAAGDPIAIAQVAAAVKDKVKADAKIGVDAAKGGAKIAGILEPFAYQQTGREEDVALGGGAIGAIKGFGEDGLKGGLLGFGKGYIGSYFATAKNNEQLLMDEYNDMMRLDERPEEIITAKRGGFIDKDGEISLIDLDTVNVQLENGEIIVTPDAKILESHADKLHKDMDDDEVTDSVPDASYILSAMDSYSISLEDAEEILLEEDKVFYSEYGQVPTKMRHMYLSDFFKKGEKELNYAELGRRIRDKYKIEKKFNSSGESIIDEFTTLANEENKANRMQKLTPVVMLNESQRQEDEMKEVQKLVDDVALRELASSVGIDVTDALPEGETVEQFAKGGKVKKKKKYANGGPILPMEEWYKIIEKLSGFDGRVPGVTNPDTGLSQTIDDAGNIVDVSIGLDPVTITEQDSDRPRIGLNNQVVSNNPNKFTVEDILSGKINTSNLGSNINVDVKPKTNAEVKGDELDNEFKSIKNTAIQDALEKLDKINFKSAFRNKKGAIANAALLGMMGSISQRPGEYVPLNTKELDKIRTHKLGTEYDTQAAQYDARVRNLASNLEGRNPSEVERLLTRLSADRFRSETAQNLADNQRYSQLDASVKFRKHDVLGLREPIRKTNQYWDEAMIKNYATSDLFSHAANAGIKMAESDIAAEYAEFGKLQSILNLATQDELMPYIKSQFTKNNKGK